MTHRLVLVHFTTLAFAFSLSAQTYWVDPVNGSNSAAGTAAAPFRTISFAATQSPAGPLTLNLFPGDYSATSGETFPIVLPENVRVQSVRPCSVNIRHRSTAGAPATPAMKVTLSSLDSTASFSDLRFTGNQQGLLVEATGNDHIVTLDFVRTEISASNSSGSGRGVHVVSRAGTIEYGEFGRVSRDAAIGSIFETTASGRIFGFVTNGYTTGIGALPTGTGYQLVSDGLEIEISFANTIFQRHLRGIETKRLGGLIYVTDVTHCAFHANGRTVLVQTPGGGSMAVVTGGAISESVGSVDDMDVSNSAFWQNAADLPDYTGLTYSVGDNIIQDAAVIAATPLANNNSGDPQWVAANQGDFHILPGSPCRNAVSASLDFDFDVDLDVVPGAGTLVVDADDRTLACAGQGEIGPDESFDADYYVRGGSFVTIGSTIKCGLYGDGGSLANLVVASPLASTAPNFDACGLQVDLGSAVNLVSPFLMPGVPGGRAFAMVDVVVPSSTSLLGQQATTAAAFVTNPTGIPALVFAANTRSLTFCN